MTPAAPADHVTPYDRLALNEPTVVAMLAAREPNPALVEFFGPALHADLARLARASLRPRKSPGRRVYVLPGIMGSQLGFSRGSHKPNDILWLDPIDFALGRIVELKLTPGSRVIPLGAMHYTYLKLTLSLRSAGFDAVMVDYDWRRDVATTGKLLAERILADGASDAGIVAHSMGGLVARAALKHAAGARVSRLVMLGTPNSGSYGAVQALRGVYSVVRKVAMLDPHHDAEFLAREVFASFPGLHELLPCDGRFELFDGANWPGVGPGPEKEMLRNCAGLASRLAAADRRFHVVIGCNRITATAVSRRDDDFEYEYGLQGDGTVPVALAKLEGADHRYVDCGHSDLPLSDRVIAGTVDLLKTGRSRRFAAQPGMRRGTTMRVRDSDLRREYLGKVDWPHMTSDERRQFLDTLNEPPQGVVSALTRAAPKKRSRKKPIERAAPRRPRRGK